MTTIEDVSLVQEQSPPRHSSRAETRASSFSIAPSNRFTGNASLHYLASPNDGGGPSFPTMGDLTRDVYIADRASIEDIITRISKVGVGITGKRI